MILESIVGIIVGTLLCVSVGLALQEHKESKKFEALRQKSGLKVPVPQLFPMFQPKIARRWGRLEERWLIQEAATKKNVADLRMRLAHSSGTRIKGMQTSV